MWWDKDSEGVETRLDAAITGASSLRAVRRPKDREK